MEKIKPPETLTEQAYKAIKSSIINNEVKPLEYLAEEKIANDLGISRTPIREALRQLSYEGLVEMNKGTRARVSAVSPEDALDYQILREKLETLSAGLVAKCRTNKDIAFLEKICNDQEYCIKVNDFHQFIELDLQFHSYLAETSKNSKLKEFVVNLINQIQRFLVLTNTLQESGFGAIEEHREIIEAIKRQNQEEAEEKMRLHVQNVTKRILT